jgi:hypothetical protein
MGPRGGPSSGTKKHDVDANANLLLAENTFMREWSQHESFTFEQVLHDKCLKPWREGVKRSRDSVKRPRRDGTKLSMLEGAKRQSVTARTGKKYRFSNPPRHRSEGLADRRRAKAKV